MASVSKTTIISTEDARGGKRVCFEFLLDDGRTIGPFVEQRGKDADPQEFADSAGAAINEELKIPAPSPEKNFLETVFGFPDEVIKTAFGIEQAIVDAARVKKETANAGDAAAAAIP